MNAPGRSEEGRTWYAPLRRWFAVVVFAGQGLTALLWHWMMPQGFPAGHPRFWANTIFPPAALLLCAWGLAAALARKDGQVRLLLAFLALFWGAAFVGARVLYPISAQGLWLVGLAGALLLLLTAIPGARRPTGLKEMTLVAAASVTALLSGAVLPWTQRSPEPDTRPLNVALPNVRGSTAARPEMVTLGEGVQILTGGGTVVCERGRCTLQVEPLLTFVSRSPDRCWTNLAPLFLREGPPRTLIGSHGGAGTLTAVYRDDGQSLLRVRALPGAETVIEGYSRLERPVFSHLNTWCALRFSGHRRLSVTFSPCASVPIEVLPSDYPAGSPVRFAYRTGDGRFRVVEAGSGEKGPFRTLASGRLEREEALLLTLADEGKPVCRLRFDDWARQAGTQLSPSAGWGVPVNAVEFARAGQAPDSSAEFYFTLAGTSIGRGWDSVGHGAGTYRNRMEVEWTVAASRGASGSTR